MKKYKEVTAFEFSNFLHNKISNSSTIDCMIGTTFDYIDVDNENNIIKFVCSNGYIVEFYHNQDCCEHVYIESINGDLGDLINTPILTAEVRTNKESEGYDSSTWTFYTFATIKGYVDVRWFGSSNGYYSEKVDIRVKGLPNNNLSEILPGKVTYIQNDVSYYNIDAYGKNIHLYKELDDYYRIMTFKEFKYKYYLIDQLDGLKQFFNDLKNNKVL